MLTASVGAPVRTSQQVIDLASEQMARGVHRFLSLRVRFHEQGIIGSTSLALIHSTTYIAIHIIAVPLLSLIDNDKVVCRSRFPHPTTCSPSLCHDTRTP